MFRTWRKYCKLISVLLLLAMISGCAVQSEAVPTPEAVAVPEPAPTTDPGEALIGKLLISEVMVKNHATLSNDEGGFPDWIELANFGSETVQLEGWGLSDNGDKAVWKFPAVSIEPGALLLVYADGRDSEASALHADFSLSEGETLSLFSPMGTEIDRVELKETEADCSLVFTGEEPRLCKWPSPGYENSSIGYEAFCLSRSCAGPLIINEASVFDINGGYDWVEIKNISASAVELSDFYLSDDREDRAKWHLPALSLKAGELIVIYCDAEASELDASLAPFSISGEREELYLSSSDGELLDFVSLHDIPIYGSRGRNSETEGFVYFTQSSPGAANGRGMRRVSEMPVALTDDGVFNGVESVMAELSAEGKIYYTTDGTVPTTESESYTGNLEIKETSVLRAIAVEEGALPSRAITLSYIINEEHKLPVISLVVDDKAHFDWMRHRAVRNSYCVGNVAFYEKDGGFNKACLVDLKGWTSLSLPKNSLGVRFKGALGGELEYDVFNNGINSYYTLSIRAGQDYTFSYIRNELFQEICLDMDSQVLTQESRYSVLYINGEYWGLYCLKEDLSRSYYASHAGVSKESVEVYKAHFETNQNFREEVYDYCRYNDLSDPECYETICSRINIDSFVDWFIIQSYSANTDLRGNTRYYRSTENGNKWTVALYDLDWAFHYPKLAFGVIPYRVGTVGVEIPEIFVSLLENEDFRNAVLVRYSQLSKTLLSDESVLERIDSMAAEIEPEVARDRKRWNLSLEAWYKRVDDLRSVIIDYDYNNYCIRQLCDLLKLTAEEREYWFGS